MADDGALRINDRLAIPRSELEFKATRSGGPGGQHVNTASTRIELTWNVADSASLTEPQRRRLIEQLGPRLDSGARLRVVSQEERSQLQNRESAAARLAELVRRALVVPRKRKPTRPTKASKEQRLREKKQRSELKRERRRDRDD
jgi:ribosome-associated protein